MANGNFEPIQRINFSAEKIWKSNQCFLVKEGDYVNVEQTLVIVSDFVDVNTNCKSIL
jgi:hypothetical protein